MNMNIDVDPDLDLDLYHDLDLDLDDHIPECTEEENDDIPFIFDRRNVHQQPEWGS